MDNLFLISGGLIGMLVALVHGYIGEFKLIGPMDGPSPEVKKVIRCVFQLSTLYWFAGGLAMVVTPYVLNAEQRTILAATVVFLFATGAAGNLWLSRGRHIGWVLLVAASLLVALGA